MTSLHSEYEPLYVIKPTHSNNIDQKINDDNRGTTSVSNAIESTSSSLALQDSGQTETTHLSMDKSSEEEHPQQQTSCNASGADTLSSKPQGQLVSTWDSTAESGFLTYVSEDITEGMFITTASGTIEEEESSIENSSLFSTNMSDKLSHSTTHLSMDKLLEEDHSQQLTSCTASAADPQCGTPYTQERLVLNWEENNSTTEGSFPPYLSENTTESTFITTASETMEESSADLFSLCNMPDKLSLSNPPSGYTDLNHGLRFHHNQIMTGEPQAEVLHN